jgi:AcrR family transcriptional regulator
MNMRQKQALKTKDKIYNSALELISTKGFENVLIKDITNHAGIAKGSFYNHFSSKENLLLYTYKKNDEIISRSYEMVKNEEDFFILMNSFINKLYIEIEKLGNEIIRAMCINLLSKDSRSAFFDKDRALYTALTDIIEIGKKSRYLSNKIPTDSFVNKILTLMIGIENNWCLLDRDSGLAEYAADNINTLLIGLAHL